MDRRSFWYCCTCRDGPHGVSNIPACNCGHCKCNTCEIFKFGRNKKTNHEPATAWENPSVPRQRVNALKPTNLGTEDEYFHNKATPASLHMSRVDMVKSEAKSGAKSTIDTDSAKDKKHDIDPARSGVRSVETELHCAGNENDRERDTNLSLEAVVDGLATSSALEGTHANTKRNPDWVTNTLKGLKENLTHALELVDRLENIPPGYRRLIYQCQCGYIGHDDYLEYRENSLQTFAGDLRDTGLFTHVTILDKARGRIAAFVTNMMPNIIYKFRSLTRKIIELPRKELPLPLMDDTKVPPSLDCPPENRCKHIHLCRQRGPSTVPWLEHMHVCYSGKGQNNRDFHNNYDTIFFTKLRKNFNTTCSFGEKLLFRLKQIDFVKFELLPLRSVECRGRPELPPSQADYEFSPAADGLSPPIGPRLMMHLFRGHHPLVQHSSLFFDRLPKKRGQPLEYNDQLRDVNIGWGLDFVMVFNFRLVVTLVFILDLLASLIIACLWSTLGHDIQGAFTVAAWISAILGVGVATLQAWII